MLKCINSLTHRNNCKNNKERYCLILYNTLYQLQSCRIKGMKYISFIKGIGGSTLIFTS